MDYLTTLNQSVTAVLAANRIGAPIFVRWTAATAASADELKPHLAAMTIYTTHWLHGELRRLYATGDVGQGHLALTLEYATGNSALLALTLARGRPHVSLAIFGNQGAIYHSDFIVPARDGDLAPPSHTDFESDEKYLVLSTIEASLSARQPVELSATGAPL
ncbi:MAG: hypothetical protein R2911_42315 [Caldilineaceae bacterium]